MRRGYRRERRAGASLDEQDKSLRASGIAMTGVHPPVYTDMLKGTGSGKPLTELLEAIRTLRDADEDELVIHDAATIGRNHQEIVEAFAAIGRSGCKLIIWTPTPREFVWHPDAAEIAAVAAEAMTILNSERGKVSQGKTLGAAPKLIGPVMVAAKAAWSDPKLTADKAAAKVYEVTGIKVSARLLFSKLGNKSHAELAMLKPPMPKPSKPKRKAKRKAR